MSPVVRKWGIRAIAGLFCTAILLCATALIVVAFAGATQVMESTMDTVAPLAQIPTAEPTWWNILDRYGLPMLLIAVAGFYGKKAIVAVWQYLKPIGQDVGEAASEAFRKISRFADQGQVMLEKQQENDKTFGIQIEGTHSMVKEMHGVIVKK